MEEIEKIIAENDIINIYTKIPKCELKTVLFYLKNNLIVLKNEELTEEEKKDNLIRYDNVKACLEEDYSYLKYILNYKNRVNISSAVTRRKEKRIVSNICRGCNFKNCILYLVHTLLEEMERINEKRKDKISGVEIVETILQEPKMQETISLEKSELEKFDVYTLLFAQVILDGDLVQLDNYDDEKKVATIKYVDLSKIEDYKYFSNKLRDYYDNMTYNTFKIKVKDFNEKKKKVDDYEYFYKVAGYLEYLRKVEKKDVLQGIEKHLKEMDTKIIANRSKYFTQDSLSQIEELPCNEKVKKQITELLNYVFNYYVDKTIPYIPINIIFYTEDKEIVKKVEGIIGEFMWFYNYFSNDMRYYEKSMNEIILDKFAINGLYVKQNEKKEIINKTGMMLIENFESLAYIEAVEKNRILNLLTEQIEKNNKRVCTVIYGKKETIKKILNEYPKLNTTLFNIELDIDELNVETIYQLLIETIEKNEKLDIKVKEKIYNYIKQSYENSEIKNMEYVKNLYNRIILNENRKMYNGECIKIGLDDIPTVYNTKDLEQILAELNNLVGLEKIKKEINNLVSLLKFNKNANLDISKLNLHMVFMGNPGTGKTTVARLISDIFYNLGYIRKNKLIEVSAKDLIAPYIGQTAGKTYNVMKSALGGVLFIDEAYALVSEHTFSEDCLSTIVKVMEDEKDNLVVIFAGYQEEMKNFIKANVGLSSRIGYNILFEDYTTEELIQIFDRLLEENKFKITQKAKEKIINIVESSKKIEGFGNARYIHNLYQNILIAHAKNVENVTNKKELMTIVEEDLNPSELIAKRDEKRTIGF